MKLLSWHKVVLVFFMLWLPIDQVLAFNSPICVLAMDAMDCAASNAEGGGGQDAGPTQPSGDRDALGCMMFTHCHFCNAWGFTPVVALSQSSLVSFVVLFNSPNLAQFDPDRLERPPRTVLA